MKRLDQQVLLPTSSAITGEPLLIEHISAENERATMPWFALMCFCVNNQPLESFTIRLPV